MMKVDKISFCSGLPTETQHGESLEEEIFNIKSKFWGCYKLFSEPVI